MMQERSRETAQIVNPLTANDEISCRVKTSSTCIDFMMSMACLFISNLQTRQHGFTIEIIKIHQNTEI